MLIFSVVSSFIFVCVILALAGGFVLLGKQLDKDKKPVGYATSQKDCADTHTYNEQTNTCDANNDPTEDEQEIPQQQMIGGQSSLSRYTNMKGKPWTDRERIYTAQLRKAGFTPKEISNTTGRSVGSIQNQLNARTRGDWYKL